jgi:hypothetical protein
VLLCVRLGHTKRDQAQAARAALERLPHGPVGLVLTDYVERDTDYYRGYYYRDYAGASGGEGQAPARAPVHTG